MRQLLTLAAVVLMSACGNSEHNNTTNTIINTNTSNAQVQKKQGTMEQIQFKSNEATLSGAIFYPENYEANQTYPALIVTGAWTTVKEQMPMLYAEKLAKKGFITLVFDFNGWGQSEGDNRYVEDPVRKTADIIAASDYLRSRTDVASNEVGGVGVCASSGYMVDAYAAQKLNSVALVAPWLHNPELAIQVSMEARQLLQIYWHCLTRHKHNLKVQVNYKWLLPLVQPILILQCIKHLIIQKHIVV